MSGFTSAAVFKAAAAASELGLSRPWTSSHARRDAGDGREEPRRAPRHITVGASASIYRRQESVRTPETFPETNPKTVPPSAKHRLASALKAPTFPAML